MGWEMFAIEAAILVGDFVYHRLTDPAPSSGVAPADQVSIPRTDPSAPYPLLYGTCLVKSPMLAWISTPQTWQFNGKQLYGANMLFVVGIPFQDGTSGKTKLLGVMIGNERGLNPVSAISSTATIAASPPGGQTDIEIIETYGIDQTPFVVWGWQPGTINTLDAASAISAIEWYDGSPAQALMNANGTPRSIAGFVMSTTTDNAPAAPWNNYNGTLTGDVIPAFRGFVSVCMYGVDAFFGGAAYCFLGQTPQVPAFQFEVQTLPNPSLASGVITDPLTAAVDANPADVIYDVLTSFFGKLGLDPALVDTVSFRAAATTLFNEGHGYSRSWEQGGSAVDLIKEILVQIDGVIYTDPSDNLVKLKLIRADYDPQAIPLITPDNCKELQNFALGGWQDIPTIVTVKWTNRVNGYIDDVATATAGATAIVNGREPIVIEMPGVCTAALASQLAARELAAQSRPLAKCTAIVNRSFYNVCPGDAVSITWPEANISGMVFRVAAVDRGTLANGQIKLDLIQDYFYQWRDQRPTNPAGGSFGSPTTVANGG